MSEEKINFIDPGLIGIKKLRDVLTEAGMPLMDVQKIQHAHAPEPPYRVARSIPRGPAVELTVKIRVPLTEEENHPVSSSSS